MINGLVDALKGINIIVYHNNSAIKSLNYAQSFSLISGGMNYKLNQLLNKLKKLESYVSTIYNYIVSLSN